MKRLILCLVALALVAPPCAAQDPRGPFADVPVGHWAYQDVDTLQKAGVVFGHPEGTVTGRREVTRHDFAVAVAGVLAQASSPSPSGTDLEARLLASPPALAALQEMVRRFKPDLARLNVDTDAAQARLMGLAQTARRLLVAEPFPDVPPTHWAASSVETLRRQGLIAGYPQGIFSLPR